MAQKPKVKYKSEVIDSPDCFSSILVSGILAWNLNPRLSLASSHGVLKTQFLGVGEEEVTSYMCMHEECWTDSKYCPPSVPKPEQIQHLECWAQEKLQDS